MAFVLGALILAGWATQRTVFSTQRPASRQSATADGLSGAESKEAATKAAEGWISLFDGRSLDGWKVADYGGPGGVTVEDGCLYLEMGTPLTGVTYTRDIPRIDYEVSLEAQRVEGGDFFCGLTFPVGKDPCTLILGGWSGSVCGLSSIDGQDASENETTTYRHFENGRWYHVRLRVQKNRIRVWLDGEPLIDQDIAGRRISIRIEVEPSVPFGFATYETTAALRNIRIRRL